MPKKLILSSAGLRNVQNRDEFIFIFGSENIMMSNYSAEFISPKVSKLHQIDPTVGFISFNSMINQIGNEKFTQKLFDPKLFSQISNLSRGEEIEIQNEEDIQYLILISILLENDELFTKLTELLDLTSPDNDQSIDICIRQLQLSELLNENFSASKFDYKKLIDKIASNFYSIDSNKLKLLSPSTIHRIISSEELKLNNEDSLFDFIHSYKEERTDIDIDIHEFYEELELNGLSEEKFVEFLELFDFNSMTSTIWSKLKHCFYFNYKDNQNKYNKNRYSTPVIPVKIQEKEIKYTGSSFAGIINQLSLKCNGNVDENNLVKVTSSSTLYSNYLAKYAVDFNQQKFFHSNEEQYPWIQYDFLNNKICPTNYSIKTHSDYNSCPKSWVIEGSNSGNEGDWHQLDKQENNSIFQPHNPVSHTFEIQQSSSKEKEKEYYRYIRLKSTGPNNKGYNYLVIEALEFFGFITPDL